MLSSSLAPTLRFVIASGLVALAIAPLACATGLEPFGGGAGGAGGEDPTSNASTGGGGPAATGSTNATGTTSVVTSVTSTGPGGTTSTSGPGPTSSSNTSVVSSSSGGGPCDNTGDCQICAECAQLSGCSAEADACLFDLDCLDYNDCIGLCGPQDQACYDSCANAYPAGAAIFNEYALCVVCEECYNDCDGASAGCP